MEPERPGERQTLVTVERIAGCVLTLRDQKVMLDADLASLYAVPTKRLNEQVKRNAERFPEDFVFQLTEEEDASLRSQIATSNERRGGRRYCPYAFTEHGAIMAATVLNSPQAIQMSVYVVRAFVHMRRVVATRTSMEKRLAEIEGTLIGHDTVLRDLYEKLRPLLLPPPAAPRRRIGFYRGDP